ncbi:MAG: hypothetical protein O2827_06690, partial [Verrucomicrobia bacterium]|nr:hypothetical protein [Verrucomicrobiota bacterium]
NSFFEIVGTDIQSTQFANELSDYVAESILKEFAEDDYLPTRKILVQLFNKDTAFSEGESYKLNISDLGFVTLNVAWDESLSLPKMIEALVVSFLQSLGYANYGHLFLDECPSKAWLLKGLSQNIYLSLRPSVSRLFYEKAILDGFDPNHLKAKLSDMSVPSEAQSFALYRLINSYPISREDRLKIYKQSLLGKDSSQLILSAFGLETVESLRSTLSSFLNTQLKNNSAQFESLASSKNWLEVLGDFSSIEIKSTKAKDNSLHLLWENRADPAVVQFIEARIRLISLALNQINPLYYNAAQSLALTYQKILDGVEEWELLFYFSDFLGEFDKANAVSLEITRQLQSERP